MAPNVTIIGETEPTGAGCGQPQIVCFRPTCGYSSAWVIIPKADIEGGLLCGRRRA